MKQTELEQRIEQLESKISFQEITIEDLNEMVILLQAESAKMKEQLSLLSQKLKTAQTSNIASLKDETPPPHY